MAPDTVSRTVTTSLGGRLGGAIKGVLVGMLLFILSFPLLFWNEGRSVETYKTLKEGAGSVNEVSADGVDSAYEGKLIHIAGKAVTDDVLTDSVFGISANAIKLVREVQMYQWVETESRTTKKKVGGSTETDITYKYSKGWSSSVQDSSRFEEPDGHQNPGAMPYEPTSWLAGSVRIGKFSLSRSQIERIGGKSSLRADAAALPAELAGKASVHNGLFYIGANPSAPAVGDLKVSFSVVTPTDVSVIAMQAGDSFKPYQTKAGGMIDRLQTGMYSAAEMFEQAKSENKVLTWVLRLVGFILMMAGLNMVLRPLSVAADVLPFLGTLVEAGTGLICLLLALVLSSATIAVAWIFYRPLLGILLLAVAAGAGTLAAVKMKGAKAAVAAGVE